MLILNASLMLINVHDVSIVQNTGPFFTLVLAALFFGEKLTLAKFACCVVCFIGILTIIDPSVLFFWNYQGTETETSSSFLIGNLLMLLWALNRSFINILLKKGKFISWQF